jgi:peptide/nickel transport system permease protein
MIARLRYNPRFMVSAILLAAVLVFALIGPLLPGRDPFKVVGGLFNSPSGAHWLGTDNFGHDVLSQLMAGTRTSLIIGVIAGAVATVIGVALGTAAGFKGGLLEEILMGVTNVIISIPAIVILILLSVALSNRSIVTMALIIGVTSWPWLARAVRAQASSLRTREHVDIARLSGAGSVRLIVFEVIPYMLSYISMAFVLQLAGAILAEAGLSLLGLGPANVISLGIMLHWALLWESVRTGAWWAFVPPTIMLTLIAFALFMLQSSLDELFNPRLRRGAPRRRPAVAPVAPAVAPIPVSSPSAPAASAMSGSPTATDADAIRGVRQ